MDTVATEILEDILLLCGLQVLQSRDDEVWERFKVWAYEESVGGVDEED